LCASLLKDESKRATSALRLAARGADWAACLTHINKTLDSPKLFGLEDQAKPRLLVAWFAQRLRRIDRTLAHKLKTPDKLHRLRIKVKNARYAAELLSTVAVGRRLEVVSLLKDMQTALGDLHDLTRLGEWLRESKLPMTVRTRLRRKIDTLEVKHRKRYLAGRKPLRRAIASCLVALSLSSVACFVERPVFPQAL